MIRLSTIFFFSLLFSVAVTAQTRPKRTATPSTSNITASAAYAEIALRHTEMEAELESLLVDYTEEFPKVKELRQGIGFLSTGAARLGTGKEKDTSKLSSALGKLIVRKAEIEIDLWKLQQAYADNHPEVRRAKRKVEIYEKAIKDILG